MLPMLLLSVALTAVEPYANEPSATEFLIAADDWARPRSGARVVNLPSLRAAVTASLTDGGTHQVIVVHPGGEAGALWGAEIRDWLVSLGFTPAQVVLRAGSPRDDAVMLRLERAR